MLAEAGLSLPETQAFSTSYSDAIAERRLLPLNERIPIGWPPADADQPFDDRTTEEWADRNSEARP